LLLLLALAMALLQKLSLNKTQDMLDALKMKPLPFYRFYVVAQQITSPSPVPSVVAVPAPDTAHVNAATLLLLYTASAAVNTYGKSTLKSQRKCKFHSNPSAVCLCGTHHSLSILVPNACKRYSHNKMLGDGINSNLMRWQLGVANSLAMLQNFNNGAGTSSQSQSQPLSVTAAASVAITAVAGSSGRRPWLTAPEVPTHKWYQHLYRRISTTSSPI
jgi:hypothetical protein